MQKHAYLILAHTDIGQLENLVSALDDVRNDIYIHLDKKTKFSLCSLSTKYANLYILQDRIDVRWGDFSMVEAEYLLFEEAFKKEYAYYHLISGADLPIKSQDFIHNYCHSHQGVEYIGFAQNITNQEIQYRSQHYFLFSKDFKTKSIFKRITRIIFLKLQDLIGYKRGNLEIKKGAQWCSITHAFVEYLLKYKSEVKENFHHTFCPDEMFIQTLCWNSEFRNNLFDIEDEFKGCKRYISWKNGELMPILASDIDKMQSSDKWFARKFDSEDTTLLKKILRMYETN